ncbi:putative RNA-directed DNA polymerase [Helianthus annuus]|nr:putative RNA-directed DNA polymerase [Helianthus annuus]
MSDVWLGSFKLFVSIARFVDGDKVARPVSAQREKEAATSDTPHANPNSGGSVGNGSLHATVGNGRSFADSLLNRNKVDVISIDDSVERFSHWKGSALRGKVMDINTLTSLNQLLSKNGWKDLDIKYLGGLTVALVFYDSRVADNFLHDAHSWAGWFESLQPWEDGVHDDEGRIAWLQVHGVPAQLALDEVFDVIVSRHGKVVQSASISGDDNNLSYGLVGVLTKVCKRIEDRIDISWRGRSYNIWVDEDVGEWVPECIVDLEEDESSVQNDADSQAEQPHDEREEGEIPQVEVDDFVQLEVEDDVHCNNANEGGERVDAMEGSGCSQTGVSKGRKKFRRRSLFKNRIEGSGSLERPKKRPRENNDLFGLDRLIGILSGNSDGVGSDGSDNAAVDDVFVTPDLNRRASADPKEVDASCEVTVVDDGGTSPNGAESVQSPIAIETDQTILLSRALGVQNLDSFVPSVIEVLRNEGYQEESQFVSLDTVPLGRFWGVGDFNHDWVPSTGRSGGLVSLWDPRMFVMDRVVKNSNWLLVSGVIKGSGHMYHMLNVYSSQNIAAKRVLWEDIHRLLGEGGGRWIVAGDFNSVRYPEERRNSNFNDFIDDSGLHEYSLKGRRFTFVAGDKLSRIDRLFVSWDVLMEWPCAEYIALERVKSDHSPLLLKTGSRNFGPKPFKFYNSWLGREDFEAIVKGTLQDGIFEGSPDARLLSKFKLLRQNINTWVAMVKGRELEERRVLEAELYSLDQAVEDRSLKEEEVWSLTEIKRRLGELDGYKQRDLKQKARCSWASHGDDNSRYFHGCINKRKVSNHIPGLEVNGRWVTGSSIIKREVMVCRFSPGVGSSFITLIPKIGDPSNLGDFRPISLIGSIIKVVSKVLANRLKVVLGRIVSETQSAFLSGRYILDGLLMTSEVISWAKKRDRKIFLFKIDFEKAYDNVNWDFLLSVLSQMDFPSIWCDWIRGILVSSRASVLVNGSPTFEFGCQKGIRQGDPLSPFLFIILMEALSGMINQACDIGAFQGVKFSNDGPSLSHLLYADDAMLMGDWSVINFNNMRRILRIFYLCSGLKINLHKSVLYGVGVEEEEVASMAADLGCKQGSLPFLYLGIKVGANMNRVSNWDPVVSKFKSRLSKWKANTLSIAGRLTLVKSVLHSLPIYYFSLFKASKKVIGVLEGLMRRFLWGGSDEVRRMSWVAWDIIKKRVKDGGLGVPSLEVNNNAMLIKWLWRFLNEPNALWRRVVFSIHGSARFWGIAPCNNAFTGVWKNCVKFWNKHKVDGVGLNCVIRGNPGNGTRIRFWLDTWLGNEPLKNSFPLLYALEKSKRVLLSDRLACSGGTWSVRWEWTRHLDTSEEVGCKIALEALMQPIFLNDTEDTWYWSHGVNNGFEVADVKRWLNGSPVNSLTFEFRWSPWVPNKCNIFMWRAFLDRLSNENGSS